MWLSQFPSKRRHDTSTDGARTPPNASSCRRLSRINPLRRLCPTATDLALLSPLLCTKRRHGATVGLAGARQPEGHGLLGVHSHATFRRAHTG